MTRPQTDDSSIVYDPALLCLDCGDGVKAKLGPGYPVKRSKRPNGRPCDCSCHDGRSKAVGS